MVAEDAGCDIQVSISRDARPTAYAEQVLRLTCMTHGVYADSDVAAIRNNSVMIQHGQALERLVTAHG